MRIIVSILSAVLILGSAACTAAAAQPGASPTAPPPIAITSPAFEPGAEIPAKYTCSGEDSSPPLEWAAPPEGTQSFALIMDDPDAPIRIWVHWLVYNLPPIRAACRRALPARKGKPLICPMARCRASPASTAQITAGPARLAGSIAIFSTSMRSTQSWAVRRWTKPRCSRPCKDTF